MKKDLIKLIDSRKEIEKMFHPFDGSKGTSFERISDVPEFQNWLQEIKLELQGIYDRTHDTFVWETINLCGKRLDGFTEKKYFIELVGKLQAIRKILINIIRTRRKSQDCHIHKEVLLV